MSQYVKIKVIPSICIVSNVAKIQNRKYKKKEKKERKTRNEKDVILWMLILDLGILNNSMNNSSLKVY